jgi:ActR/RegA family two-component response regulator
MLWYIATILQTTIAAAETGVPHHAVIDLKQRATDYKEAFETLKKEKSSGKIYFELTSGTTIGNIVEMNLMGNGHLIVFKFNSGQGIRQQVVAVEQISGLFYTP